MLNWNKFIMLNVRNYVKSNVLNQSLCIMTKHDMQWHTQWDLLYRLLVFLTRTLVIFLKHRAKNYFFLSLSLSPSLLSAGAVGAAGSHLWNGLKLGSVTLKQSMVEEKKGVFLLHNRVGQKAKETDVLPVSEQQLAWFTNKPQECIVQTIAGHGSAPTTTDSTVIIT